MILECDVGNTYCKWRLMSKNAVLERGRFSHADGFNDLPVAELITRVKVANVAKASVIQRLVSHLEWLSVKPEFAQSTAVAAGVVNSYSEPAKLGVDRWLALIAAYKHGLGAALVFDAGTALTADLVDSGGRHLGGYIVPGTQLMRSCLVSDTGQVRFDDRPVTGLDFGCSTSGAVSAGINSAHVGLLLVAIDQAKKSVSGDLKVFLTGGGAKALLADLPKDVGGKISLVPDLVLDGLRWVLP